jgi:hypothetical protein
VGIRRRTASTTHSGSRAASFWQANLAKNDSDTHSGVIRWNHYLGGDHAINQSLVRRASYLSQLVLYKIIDNRDHAKKIAGPPGPEAAT